MVESSARELGEDDMVRALVAGHEAIKVICAVQRQMMAEVGKVKRPAPKKEIDHALAHEIAAALEPPLYEAMQKRDKLEMYAKMDAVKKAYVATIPEDQAAKKALVSTVYDQLREHILRTRDPRAAARLDGRRFDEIRPITSEVGVLPAHPRLGALHPRRDPGPGHRHPRNQRRRPDHRHRPGTRVQEALHAALQLPALLGRRGQVPAWPGPARDRPRRPGRARPARHAARRGELPLHGPHRLRHPRVERLVLDGLDLRRLAGLDGRRRAAQAAGGRRGHGPGQGRRALGRPDRHRRRGRPLRRHGLQGGRHARRHHRPADGHQDLRHHARDPGPGPRAGPPGPALHPRQDDGVAGRAAREHQRLRAAHHHGARAGRQDPRRHRTRRQDDPLHHRADGLQDRDRG